MTTQTEKAVLLHSLHAGNRPLVLFNIWDPGSAKAVAEAGAQALATGSWSVAAANGYADGENIPLEAVLSNLTRIVACSALPVTVDLESGYGQTAGEVGNTVRRAIEAGAAGCNLEDSYPANGSLRPLDEQVERISQARRAVDSSNIPFFINARTDVFFQKPPAAHDAQMVELALERARAYAGCGADGLFVPGLVDETLIASLVRASPLPVNIMAGAGTPSFARLAELGVARISHGPGPYFTAMQALTEAASKASAF